VEAFPDVLVVYPVHLNPNVQRPVKEILGPVCNDAGPQGRLALLPPLEYAPFVYLLIQSYLVLTDSGGIQEEARPWGNRCRSCGTSPNARKGSGSTR
jgi:UDP-N-acetylglucosamine 2-epimerase (non-hydrolysing)